MSLHDDELIAATLLACGPAVHFPTSLVARGTIAAENYRYAVITFLIETMKQDAHTAHRIYAEVMEQCS
ncbi:MAG: hypothetical protein HC794_09365 [Nitrospiraceae bacterium]|nr:hypothetical protein [Nitrospiraceae bacterium]